MVYNKDKWIAAYKKACADLKTSKPSSGKPCAIATLRYVRDELIADIAPNKDDEKDIRESFSELITALSKNGADEGFASNASAAAKACGLAVDTTPDVEVKD